MLPIVSVPPTVANGMANYRSVFCREPGFEPVSRDVTGWILSPNQTLQGIDDLQSFDGDAPSRRAMHQAVFEAGWDADQLMPSHRALVAAAHCGKGREGIRLDWTFSHHDRGPHLYGVKKSGDSVEKRTRPFQTVVTATVSNPSLIDGLDAVVQSPNWQPEEVPYFFATVKASDDPIEAAQKRLLELLTHLKNHTQYQKRTQIALERVQQIEPENQFPPAHDAFDNGVLSLGLTRFIENSGKHWVSEIEGSRLIQWSGQWKPPDEIDNPLRHEPQERFRPLHVKCRNGETKTFWAFTQVVRLKRYGRKRRVIVHETAALTDSARFLRMPDIGKVTE